MATQRAKLLMDMTPDEGFVRRVLEAYIDDSYYTFSDVSGNTSNPVVEILNKNREERNVLLRQAIEVLDDWQRHAD